MLTITRPDGHVQVITITDASGLAILGAVQPFLPPVAGAGSAFDGENTTAVIDVLEDTQPTATGTLTVADVDAGESTFQAGTIAGCYGSLAPTRWS